MCPPRHAPRSPRRTLARHAPTHQRLPCTPCDARTLPNRLCRDTQRCACTANHAYTRASHAAFHLHTCTQVVPPVHAEPLPTHAFATAPCHTLQFRCPRLATSPGPLSVCHTRGCSVPEVTRTVTDSCLFSSYPHHAITLPFTQYHCPLHRSRQLINVEAMIAACIAPLPQSLTRDLPTFVFSRPASKRFGEQTNDVSREDVRWTTPWDLGSRHYVAGCAAPCIVSPPPLNRLPGHRIPAIDILAFPLPNAQSTLLIQATVCYVAMGPPQNQTTPFEAHSPQCVVASRRDSEISYPLTCPAPPSPPHLRHISHRPV